MFGNGQKDLEDLLDDISEIADEKNEISVGTIQQCVGSRSFAPLLAVFGIIVLTPLGGIPGVPTTFGIVVILLAGQILIGRKSLWLPKVITERSFEGEKLHKGIEKIRPVAGWIDKILRPRLTVLTKGGAVYGIAAACVLLAFMFPPLELLPGAAAAPAGSIVLFALALMANDGLLAALGYAVIAVTLYLVTTKVPYGAIVGFFQ